MATTEVSDSWDDDFEFQGAAKSKATENWDHYFEDSPQSPKIVQRHREESWDDDDNDDDDGELYLRSEQDRTVTHTRPAAEFSTTGPLSPNSSVFSVPTSIHTYSSTAPLCPDSFPIRKERERRRLRKKSRPPPVFELVQISSQERPPFPDVDLPQPASELDGRRTIQSISDFSTDERSSGNNSSVSRRMTGKDSFGTKVSTLTTPTKLTKRKAFGFVYLGRGFGGHGCDKIELVDGSGNGGDILEQENEHEDHPKDNGVRSLMGTVRRMSLIGKHKKTNSGGGSSARIPPVLTFLSPALCGTIRSSTTTTNTGSGQRHTASHTSTANLRRALSSPTTPTFDSARPVRAHSTSNYSRPPSSSKRMASKSHSNPRNSEQSSQESSLDFRQERPPFFDPSGRTDTTSLKTPTQSSFLTPVAIQPPSPPHTETDRHIQRQSRAYTTNDSVVAPATSSVPFTPTSSLSRDNAAVGADDIRPLLSLSPTKSPLQSQQSVSLGRSTVVTGIDESTGLSFASGSGSGGSGGAGVGLPRRNSLGDLKIPAKISQAQVGLRRDLGLVREFASNVEQLKELENPYNTLVVKVQALLDTQRQRVQLPPPFDKSLPSIPSPNQLKSRPKTHSRSNTVGSATTTSHASDPSQVAYKSLVETFWNIISKYQVLWEYAELLIELGSGSGGGDGDDAMSPTTSVSAPGILQNGTGGEGNVLEGREKVISLTRDESTTTTPPLSPTTHNEAQTNNQSQPSPLPSPLRMSWRGSTGRHDLSQRQLVLLCEMLNNNGGSDNEEGLHPPAQPQLIPADDLELRTSTSSPHPSSRSQFVNAKNSTIALPKEQESGFGEENGGSAEKEKKRRSGRLDLIGIRDRLLFWKSYVEQPLQIGNSNSGEVQYGRQDHHHGRLPAAVTLAHPVKHSTTSLSSAVGSKDIHNQTQAHQQQNRRSIPRTASQIRRRGRASTGPELIKSNKGPSPTSFKPPSTSFTTSKSSRRPSLASIFRIGNPKTRPGHGIVLSTSVGAGAGVEDPATLCSTFDVSEHDLSAVQCARADDDNRTVVEEEDWDIMHSASDLDAVTAKALGNVDVSATVKGRGGPKIKTKKAGVSPRLQNQSLHENDQPDSPSLSASSYSTGLENLLAPRSTLRNRSFSASQSSIVGGGGAHGQQHLYVPFRLSQHPNFQEQQHAMAMANVEPPVSLRISPTAPLSNVNFSASSTVASSRPSFSRSTNFRNAKSSGSIHSIAPHLVMTAENIKPLLENAKEVHGKLHECIVEIQALIEGEVAVDPTF